MARIYLFIYLFFCQKSQLELFVLFSRKKISAIDEMYIRENV